MLCLIIRGWLWFQCVFLKVDGACFFFFNSQSQISHSSLIFRVMNFDIIILDVTLEVLNIFSCLAESGNAVHFAHTPLSCSFSWNLWCHVVTYRCFVWNNRDWLEFTICFSISSEACHRHAMWPWLHKSQLTGISRVSGTTRRETQEKLLVRRHLRRVYQTHQSVQWSGRTAAN